MPFRIPSSICLYNPWDHLFQSQSNNKESIIHVERKLFMKLLSRKLYYVADLDSIWLPGPLHITHTLLAFVFSQGSHRNQNEKKYKIFRTCWIGPLLLYICFWSKNVAKSAPCCFFQGHLVVIWRCLYLRSNCSVSILYCSSSSSRRWPVFLLLEHFQLACRLDCCKLWAHPYWLQN